LDIIYIFVFLINIPEMKISSLLFSFLFFIMLSLPLSAQYHTPVYNRQDTLRGSVTPERKWWDLIYYHLDIAVNPADSTIKGSNSVFYKVIEPSYLMQIDLQEPMKITRVVQKGNDLVFRREGNVFWIELTEIQEKGKYYFIEIAYEGRPRVSARPPWIGGITWSRDSDGMPFIATANQGDGASLWWPCKDHMYDEPDSMLISVNVPEKLMNVSNGRLRSVIKHKNKSKTYNWFVGSPINNYGVNINIGNYAHFSEIYNGEAGRLDCDYYVLKENLDKAKVHFRQVPGMLKAFEHWFGKYPFYKDGYKLVEAPYLGMEHQSSVTYGNGFENGYRGTDLSGSGWGLKFDFIIIHESGHEWFANSITYEDVADMWIHESFTNYSENLYVEYHFGKEAGQEYVLGTRRNIRNDRPIVGIYNVNSEGSGDMYYKGGNMLHTLRMIVDDDVKWREILRGMNTEFYHQVVTGARIEEFLSEKTGMNLQPFFDQYLRDVRIPVFEYFIEGDKLTFRWNNCVRGFDMPLKVYVSGKPLNINPKGMFSTVRLETAVTDLKVDPGYYVGTLNMTGK
jgi:aminopeptidase N